MCTMVWGGLFAFCEYLSCTRHLSLTSQGPPNIILTSLLSGVWLAFPLNLGVFYLYGRALLATRFMFAYGLATTLGIAVCCNTAIKPEFIRYALVACGVKYVRPLATTLSVVFHCNTTIRPQFVHYTLMTCGQVFVCYLATNLGIAICYDIAIRLESVRCVLAVIRFLPICRARLR